MVFCNTIITDFKLSNVDSHNPYFNRWFSAMVKDQTGVSMILLVTILILIDGFLQYDFIKGVNTVEKSQSLF